MRKSDNRSAVMMEGSMKGIKCEMYTFRFSSFDICTCPVPRCKLTTYLATGHSSSSLSCLSTASTAFKSYCQNSGMCSLERNDLLRESGAEGPASICSDNWDWRFDQLLLSGPGPTATRLMHRSFENFSKLTFDDFVEAAEGPSHALQLFLWTYDVLEWKVYSTFIKNPDCLGLLVELKEVSDTYHRSPSMSLSDTF